jgi:hypothetical protein
MLEKNLAPYILLLLVSVVSLVTHSGAQEALDRANKQISILSDNVRQYSLERAVDRETPQPVRAETLEPIQLDAYERIAFSLNVGQKANVTWWNCGAAPTIRLELQSVSGTEGYLSGASVLVNDRPMHLKVASPVVLDFGGSLDLVSVKDADMESSINSFLWTFDCGEVGP